MKGEEVVSPIISDGAVRRHSVTGVSPHFMDDAPIITSMMSAFLILNTMIGSGIFNQRSYLNKLR